MKVSSLLLVAVLLVTISTAQLQEEEWNKLVSALFTGVNLLDNHGRLLVEGSIAGILASNHRNFGKYIKQKYPTNHYFPNLAASYGETFEGGAGIKNVFFSSREAHAEVKAILNTPPRHHLQSITINYSPCVKCVGRILDSFGNLPIHLRHFSWVYDYPRTRDNLAAGVCRLVHSGFKIKVWETVRVLRYLLEQAPNPILRRELKEAIAQTASALIERDMKTQELIAVCKKIVELMEDDGVDDVEPYCHGWSNTRRHDDDDDEPGVGGATGRGGGAYSSGSRSGSSSSDTKQKNHIMETRNHNTTQLRMVSQLV